MIGRSTPRRPKTTFSALTCPSGAGKAVGAVSVGRSSSSFARRRHAALDSTRARHPDTSCSTGESARPRRMVAAIITPELTCWSTTM
jgi:hypothetical protein